jgi:(p)ppGpp synthase/HD superfamily hydrolase
MQLVLQHILDFAATAHEGQQRKYTPEPFIAHPVRVMEMVRFYNDDICVLAAALLHDVLEDTEVSKAEMKHFLLTHLKPAHADRTLKLVIELTDVYIKDDYPQWNRRKRRSKEAERISKNSADAQTIKYADIIDNCINVSSHDADFAAVFLKECKNLLQYIKKGNKQLYDKAVATVENELRQLENLPHRHIDT